MVLVPAVDGGARFEIDAERRAEQRGLDVVDGERVPGEEHVDESRADERGEVRRAARVDDDGPRHERDALPPRFDRFHHARDAFDARLDAPLGGDLVGHEREVGSLAVAKLRRHAEAAEAADDAVA